MGNRVQMRYQTRKNYNERSDNFLRAVEFCHPKWIPANIGILPATWYHYGEELEKIVLEHPRLFPDYKKGDFQNLKPCWAYQKGRHKDIWGVTWENIAEGFDSAPVEEEAPLKEWEPLEKFTPPDPLSTDWFWPEEKIDWETRRKELDEAKAKGNIAQCGLPHGFIYMWHYYLRGFSNFMMDVATHEPRLQKITEMILDYDLKLVKKWLEIGVELIYFGDDLGLQRSLPISPDDWRWLIKPSYQKVLNLCQQAGVLTYLHSDGHILEVIDDLIECGLNIINPQFRANGLNGLAQFKGKICIHLGMDRQLFPFATPGQLWEHFQQSLEALYLPEGGLMFHVEIGPDVPLLNVETIFNILEELAGPWHG